MKFGILLTFKDTVIKNAEFAISQISSRIEKIEEMATESADGDKNLEDIIEEFKGDLVFNNVLLYLFSYFYFFLENVQSFEAKKEGLKEEVLSGDPNALLVSFIEL